MATKKKPTTKPSTKPKKKVPAKKIKKPAKKKAAKTAKNPHEGKRYFMLEFSGYGGEFMFTRVPEDFVKYWLDKDRETSLTDHLYAMHEGAMSFRDDMLEEDEADEVTLDVPEGFDENSPEVREGTKYIEYWDLDDIEHATVVSAEYSSYTMTEVTLHPKAVYQSGGVEWDDRECKKRNFDWGQKQYTEKGESKDRSCDSVPHVYCVENFVHDTKKGLVDPVPVLQMYDAQKGTFGRVVVETNGEDFDPEKLVFAVNENSMTTHIEGYYYDQKPLNVDMDYLSTWGKGFHASVGYIPKGDLEWDCQELLRLGWQEIKDRG